MNKSITCCLLLALTALPTGTVAWAARDIQGEIDTVRQERLRLTEIRKSLESQLGLLGRDIHKLDKALITARKDLKVVTIQWKQADKKVGKLMAQRESLKQQIKRMQQAMQQEANAAWRRAKRQPSWLDILAGVPITEVPHRQYMARYMLEEQQKEHEQWQEALLELKMVEEKLLAGREVLTRLRDGKRALEAEAAKRLKLKQKKVRVVRRDVVLKKKKDAGLRKQEEALLKLLDGLQEALLASDNVVKRVSIRKRKGHLPWPLKGMVVENFGSRRDHQHAKLLGVQISPLSTQGSDTSVRAMAAGQVRYADWFGGFGLMMIVEYGDGIMGIYAHNDALHKQLGDWVEAGDVLAEAGSTGWVEKIRLYFELRDKGKAVNPGRWCRPYQKGQVY